jgi:hypothetical protein
MVAAQADDQIAYQALLTACTATIRAVARHRGILLHRVDDVVQESYCDRFADFTTGKSMAVRAMRLK